MIFNGIDVEKEKEERVPRLIRTTFLLICIFISSPFLATALVAPLHASLQQQELADFPSVDPDYIYNQLFYMATHFQHREAGYDTGLPENINGHDEFANYWTQEMLQDLRSFGAQVQRDAFALKGWKGRPAPVPAFNVEVSVPGVLHPEQVVVIGCHYDGEATSTQSANDDASGCAIELGVAKAMADYWRNHHTYPARTLRFVIFDAEEQGLYGSFHYLNSTINGDTHNIVAMFNEEQNGIAYPLRYFGQLANPLLPFSIDLSPLQNSQLYPAQSKLSQQQQSNIAHFHQLMQQAILVAFAQFQALGFRGLTYHENNKQDVAQPIFTPEQMNNIRLEDDTLGGSDQIPFTLAGLPCATFVGNSNYYGGEPPAYPFDQPQDTIQLMNTFADGSSHRSYALTLALALPGMLTTWMLNSPDVLGQAHATPGPIATINDIGLTQAGKSFTLDARALFDPGDAPLTYTWDFGDGTQASGVMVSHTYTTAGNYTLKLSVTAVSGMRHISKLVNVMEKPVSYRNPYERYAADGHPPSNPRIALPEPDDSLSDRIIHSPVSTVATPITPQLSARTFLPPGLGTSLIAIVVIILLVLAFVGAIFAIMHKRSV